MLYRTSKPLNPLGVRVGVEHENCPYNVHALSRKNLMRILKLIR